MLLVGMLSYPASAALSTFDPLMPDSIGVKFVNGKRYIIHRVENGESLFRISKRYKVSVRTIRAENALASDNLRAGQRLLLPKNDASRLSLRDHASASPKEELPVVPVATRTKVEEKKPEVKKVPSPRANDIVEYKRGEIEGVHVVERGQTLYGVARFYGVGVSKIVEWNSLESTGIKVGQKLRVAERKAVVVEAKPKPATVKNTAPKEAWPSRTLVKKADKPEQLDTKDEIIHEVEDGETLYSVAKKYGMTIREVRLLNKLVDTDIKKGDKLRIVTPTSLKIEEVVAVEEKEETQPVAQLDTATVVETKVEEKEVLPALPPEVVKRKAMDRRRAKPIWTVEEKGMAMGMGVSDKTNNKFYGLHRTLPKGTLVRVEYPAASQVVTVEIVGTLDSETNEIIRLSKKARTYLMMEKSEIEVVLRYSVPRDGEE